MLCISKHDTKGQVYKWLAAAQNSFNIKKKKPLLSGFTKDYGHTPKPLFACFYSCKNFSITNQF